MENRLLTVDEAAEIFSRVMNKIMTFDNEQDKTDYLLDAVIEFKKQAYDKHNSTSNRIVQD